MHDEAFRGSTYVIEGEAGNEYQFGRHSGGQYVDAIRGDDLRGIDLVAIGSARYDQANLGVRIHGSEGPEECVAMASQAYRAQSAGQSGVRDMANAFP